MDIDLSYLKYYYFVVQAGGFSKAAARLHVQPPVVSRAVKLLEAQLKLTLLERQKKFVRMTTEGEEVFAKARRIFADAAEIAQIASRLGTEVSGPIKIGCTDFIAADILAPQIASLVRDHPTVYPIVHAMPAVEAFGHIKSGALDCGLFFHVPEPPPQLEVKRVKRVRFRLVIAKRMQKVRAVRQAFIGSREVDEVDPKRYPTLEKWRRVEPEAAIKISSNCFALHKHLVLAGSGISVLPDVLVREEIRSGRLVELMAKEQLLFDMKLVTRKYAVMPRSAASLLAHICDE